MLPTFEELLAPYPTERILGAFKEHLKTKTTMPTPAEILAILDWEPLPKSAETRMFEHQAKREQEEFERYQLLTPEQKAEHDAVMAKIKAMAQTETKTPKGPGKLNFKHFERHTADQQEEIRQRFIASHRRLKGEQPGVSDD